MESIKDTRISEELSQLIGPEQTQRANQMKTIIIEMSREGLTSRQVAGRVKQNEHLFGQQRPYYVQRIITFWSRILIKWQVMFLTIKKKRS